MASVITTRRRISDLKEIETIVAAYVVGKQPTTKIEQLLVTNPLLQTINQLIKEEQGYSTDEIHINKPYLTAVAK